MTNDRPTWREFLKQSSLATLVGTVIPYGPASQRALGGLVANVGAAEVHIKIRFTQRARTVLDLSYREAARLNHGYISTEHILLALISKRSGVAINVLKNLDVEDCEIRNEIEKFLNPGPGKVPKGKLLVTSRAGKVIEFAVEEARELNHHRVGTEHILLGLLRDQKSLAGQVLTVILGLTLEDARTEVLNQLGQGIRA